MTSKEILERVLLSYKDYYDIEREDPAQPFDAEANFRLHEEQYFLLKSAKFNEWDQKETVFFSAVEDLSEEYLRMLDERAWETGLSRGTPSPQLKNADVVLIVLADRISEDAQKAFRALKHSKGYMGGLRGYSNYKLLGLEVSTGKLFFNRRGKDLLRIFEPLQESLNNS
mgnify:CR=1 FL=1